MDKRERDRRYREANKEKIAEQQKIYRAENKDSLREKAKAARERDKDAISKRRKERRSERSVEQRAREVEKSRNWHIRNKDYSALKNREWHVNNPAAVRAIKKKYKDKRLATPRGKLESNISRAIHRGITVGGKGGRRTFEILGYSSLVLKEHLEKQFKRGMSWENYGEWHVDHKIPLTAHNYQTVDDIDFKRCWALSNLQPMWGKENMSKNNRLSEPFQPSLAISLPAHDNDNDPDEDWKHTRSLCS